MKKVCIPTENPTPLVVPNIANCWNIRIFPNRKLPSTRSREPFSSQLLVYQSVPVRSLIRPKYPNIKKKSPQPPLEMLLVVEVGTTDAQGIVVVVEVGTIGAMGILSAISATSTCQIASYRNGLDCPRLVVPYPVPRGCAAWCQAVEKQGFQVPQTYQVRFILTKFQGILLSLLSDHC